MKVATLKFVLILILVSLLVLLIVQNVEVVKIRLLFWSFEMSRVLLLFLAVLAGLVTGWVLHGVVVHRRK